MVNQENFVKRLKEVNKEINILKRDRKRLRGAIKSKKIELNKKKEIQEKIKSLYEEEQKELGLSQGLIRFSIGLDNDIHKTYTTMRKCMEMLDILSPDTSLA